MLSAEQQKELLCLAINGRISPIQQFIKKLNINENGDDDNTPYNQYIKKYKPECMFCGSIVTILDFSLIRHIDCGYTNWTVGCCCCGDIDGINYHKPECAQFYCNEECYSNASDVREKVFNLRTSNEPTKEYYMLQSTNYSTSSHLMKKYYSKPT
jgi:hypothetical protein